MEPKNKPIERNSYINQTFLFQVFCLRFHVYFQGCTPKKTPQPKSPVFQLAFAPLTAPTLSAFLVRVPSGKAFGMLMLPG